MENNNLVTAKVIYKDVDAGNKPVYQKVIAGKTNSPVRLEQYKKYIPSNFAFEGYGRFNRALRNHDIDVIYVRENHVAAKGDIMVDYINANNQLIGHNKFTNQVGSHFDVNRCKSTVPKNYQFKRILTGNNINTFKSDSQIMIVQVSRIKRATITIKYLDHGKPVGENKVKSVVGTSFKIDYYVHNVPNGYKFVKHDQNVPKTFQHDQVVTIDVTKKQPQPHKASRPNVNKPAAKKNHSNDSNSPQKVGQILMRLATSLHALGETISKSHRL